MINWIIGVLILGGIYCFIGACIELYVKIQTDDEFRYKYIFSWLPDIIKNRIYMNL